MKGAKSSLVGTLFGVLTLIVLTACAKPSMPTIDSTPGVPTQSSRALSAKQLEVEARQAYEAYLSATGDAEGSEEEQLARLKPYVTEAALEEERNSLQRLSARGWHLEGAAKLRTFMLQTPSATGQTAAAYACVDLRRVRLIDNSGADVTPKTRMDLQTTRPTFQVTAGGVKLLRDASWSGKSIC